MKHFPTSLMWIFPIIVLALIFAPGCGSAPSTSSNTTDDDTTADAGTDNADSDVDTPDEPASNEDETRTWPSYVTWTPWKTSS